MEGCCVILWAANRIKGYVKRTLKIETLPFPLQFLVEANCLIITLDYFQIPSQELSFPQPRNSNSLLL